MITELGMQVALNMVSLLNACLFDMRITGYVRWDMGDCNNHRVYLCRWVCAPTNDHYEREECVEVMARRKPTRSIHLMGMFPKWLDR